LLTASVTAFAVEFIASIAVAAAALVALVTVSVVQLAAVVATFSAALVTSEVLDSNWAWTWSSYANWASILLITLLTFFVISCFKFKKKNIYIYI